MDIKELATMKTKELPIDTLAEMLQALGEMDAAYVIVAAFKMGYQQGKEEAQR